MPCLFYIEKLNPQSIYHRLHEDPGNCYHDKFNTARFIGILIITESGLALNQDIYINFSCL